ncbi:MAG TPA: quinolinate synthase NadA [Melioribacteraceae bacterium]|nr:quinolinate synthase NadA [Melioribacteraceae bacterium]
MNNNLIQKINVLKKEKNAIILAHNYQRPEIQDVADFVGDSLGLSKQAASTNAETIVFCGVHFMAETAAIISPNKKVLIPELNAGCSLADSISKEQLVELKKQYPEAVVVAYINTTAEIKTLSDYCVTSSNAVNVVNAIDKDKLIIFLPDKFLGNYVKRVTGRDIIVFDGSCHVHQKIGNVEFDKAEKMFPNSEFLVHPECGCSSSCMLKSLNHPESTKIKVLSTEGMVNYIPKSNNKSFVIATEVGILHRLNKFYPEREFYPVSENSICEYMKMITLEKLYESLLHEKFEVKLPAETIERARLPIERMLAV